MGKAPKSRAKSGALAVEALRNLPRLLQPDDSDLDGVEKAGRGLAPAERNLVAIILFGGQDSLRINDLKTMRYLNGLVDPLGFEQIELLKGVIR